MVEMATFVFKASDLWSRTETVVDPGDVRSSLSVPAEVRMERSSTVTLYLQIKWKQSDAQIFIGSFGVYRLHKFQRRYCWTWWKTTLTFSAVPNDRLRPSQ